MFQRVGAAAYRHNLDNIIRFCELLGNPQQNLKCIHVAGTNGKGSVAHLIASVLQEQGYKTGLFVSPHYKDYRERIKINGQYISRQYITRFVEKNREKFNAVNASFFEITTAIAFQYFKEKKVDYAVIEVGMGGRLDSTNIIKPVLSVITNIAYDHTQFLGNTLAKIAEEKAGIIKGGTPVVVGETKPETKPVFIRKAKQMKAPIYFTAKSAEYSSDLKGGFQKKNIATALKAIEVLQLSGIKIFEKSVRNGLKHVVLNTSFMGRWSIQQQKPLVVLDSAHNEAGIKEVLKELRQTKFQQLHFVYGTVNDKDIRKILALLPRKATYYFCKANIPRGLDAAELCSKAVENGLKGTAYTSVKAAYTAALQNASSEDMVLVSGSIFIVAELV